MVIWGSPISRNPGTQDRAEAYFASEMHMASAAFEERRVVTERTDTIYAIYN